MCEKKRIQNTSIWTWESGWNLQDEKSKNGLLLTQCFSVFNFSLKETFPGQDGLGF